MGTFHKHDVLFAVRDNHDLDLLQGYDFMSIT